MDVLWLLFKASHSYRLDTYFMALFVTIGKRRSEAFNEVGHQVSLLGA